MCRAEQIEACYDILVEIENSPLLHEYKEEIERGRINQAHHYMIYLDSVGSFELIAEGWTVEDVLQESKEGKQ